MRKALTLLVYAKTDLTVAQLVKVISIKIQDDVWDEEDIIHEDGLVDWLSSLVHVDTKSSVLELSHFSIKEYLTSARCPLQLSPASADTELAKVCVKCLPY